jgi:hypothetical protein
MMPDNPNPVSFAAFVMSMATTAAVHFGDLADPATGISEKNLPAAGQMIDLLAMLQDKTKGNLDPDEQEFLDQVLYELRLRFVDETRQAGGVVDGPRIIAPDGPRIIVP